MNFIEDSQNSSQPHYLFGMKIFLLLNSFLVLLVSCTPTIKEDEKLFKTLLQSKAHQFQTVLDSTDQYEVQIIHTQINRDEQNNPSFKSFYFNCDSSRYFYPASTVKFPAVLAALEKLNQLILLC